MYGYSITLQLYNDNIDKGMKGIEIPTGDITFDIDLKVTKINREKQQKKI